MGHGNDSLRQPTAAGTLGDFGFRNVDFGFRVTQADHLNALLGPKTVVNLRHLQKTKSEIRIPKSEICSTPSVSLQEPSLLPDS